MKAKKLVTKISLNKTTIANLDNSQMLLANGGNVDVKNNIAQDPNTGANCPITSTATQYNTCNICEIKHNDTRDAVL
ncbi:MAG: hypothetical protein GY765_23980 [bacterium]|nr:hypothetical protein [bacterium]